ncbi:ATP-binding protein [Streptomyces sp. NPDC004690]
MISHPSRHCTVELQALPSRIGQVRRIVSAHLRYWHLDPLIDRAALGVTELLTNVHQHAQPDKLCTVELEFLLGRLTVSVRDHDPRLPVVEDMGDIAPLATEGRGLAMVAAMSESWGARPDGEEGKVVWFTLPSATAPVAVTVPARVPRLAAGEQQPVRRFAEVEPALDGARAAPVPARSPVPG